MRQIKTVIRLIVRKETLSYNDVISAVTSKSYTEKVLTEDRSEGTSSTTTETDKEGTIMT